MIKIVRPRGTGKTKELMLEASKYENNLLLCKDERHMREKAMAYGIQGVNIISYLNFIIEYLDKSGNDEIIFIDNLDEFIVFLFSGNFTIGGFDITYEEE